VGFRSRNDHRRRRRRRCCRRIVVGEALVKIIRQKKQVSGRTQKRVQRKGETRRNAGKGGSQYLHAARRPEVHSNDEKTRSSSTRPHSSPRTTHR